MDAAKQAPELGRMRHIEVEVLWQILRADDGINWSVRNARDACGHLRIQPMRIRRAKNLRESGAIGEGNFIRCKERESNQPRRALCMDFIYVMAPRFHAAALAQSVTFNFVLVKASLSQCEHRGRRGLRPKRDGGAIEITRIVKSSVANKLGISGILSGVGRETRQFICEGRRTERSDIDENNCRSACG